jgi:hypothetical protein
MHGNSEIQIYSVENSSSFRATCIVRCVNGTIRPSQVYRLNSTDDKDERFNAKVEWIERFGKRATLIDSPHSAKMEFTGEELFKLTKGLIISSSIIME